MQVVHSLFAQSGSGGGIVSLVILLIQIAVIALIIAGIWKTFEKAGQPGWAALIPFYNGYVLLQVAGRPGWWLLLFFIPFVNIIIAIIVSIDVAKNFGEGTGFGLGLAFLGFIFYPLLGFGEARYRRVN